MHTELYIDVDMDICVRAYRGPSMVVGMDVDMEVSMGMVGAQLYTWLHTPMWAWV